MQQVNLQKLTESYFRISSACNGRIESRMSVATAMGRVNRLTKDLNPNRMLAHRLRTLELWLIVGTDVEADTAREAEIHT